MIKLLQKQNGAVFYASQCSLMLIFTYASKTVRACKLSFCVTFACRSNSNIAVRLGGDGKLGAGDVPRK